jgi:hypothetical protein
MTPSRSFYRYTEALFSPAPRGAIYGGRSKISLNNRIKIRFIHHGEHVISGNNSNEYRYTSLTVRRAHADLPPKPAVFRPALLNRFFDDAAAARIFR